MSSRPIRLLLRHRFRLCILLVLLAALVFIIIDQSSKPCSGCRNHSNGTRNIDDGVCACVDFAFGELAHWLASSTVAGSLVLTLVLAACAVVLIPASALTIGVGAAYSRALGVGPGVVVGALVVWIGLSIGAVLAFLVARYLLRDAVARQLRRFRLASAVDAALAHDGLRVMLLLRLAPLIPYNAFNYVIAATAVSLRDYTLAPVSYTHLTLPTICSV